MTLAIAICCAAAGFVLIAFGFVAARDDRRVRTRIDAALERAEQTVAATAAPSGLGEATQQHAAVAGATEYVKALAELAGALAKLSPAIAAFVLSTIFFFFAATLAALHELG